MSVDPQSYKNFLALGGAIVLTAVSQVMLRAGAKGKTGFMEAILDPRTLSGYVIFLIVLFLMIFAMQKIPLRTASTFDGITYILVPLLAHWVLKDPMNVRIMLGSVTIVFGIFIFFI